MVNFNKAEKVLYVKPSTHHGVGPIPINAEGKVLLQANKKILVDFGPYGKAIVPLSSVKGVS